MFYSKDFAFEMVKIKDLDVVFQRFERMNKFNTMIVDDTKITFL